MALALLIDQDVVLWTQQHEVFRSVSILSAQDLLSTRPLRTVRNDVGHLAEHGVRIAAGNRRDCNEGFAAVGVGTHPS